MTRSFTIYKFFRQFSNNIKKIHTFENSTQNDIDFLIFMINTKEKIIYNAICGVDKMKEYDLVLLKNCDK